MTANPTCCTPDTSLQSVAKTMADEDCGCLPVIEDHESMTPIGTITDRDICCRTVAEGLNPLEMTVADAMSSPVVTVPEDADIETCLQLMEENQIRRIPVVDANGACCGLVAQADVARIAPEHVAGDLVQEISRATSSASNT
ncbi:MAG: CBS domain-containing protein [Pyrinomonadaceae bacterium]